MNNSYQKFKYNEKHKFRNPNVKKLYMIKRTTMFDLIEKY